MSNRMMNRNFMSLEKAPVVLYGVVTVGTTGAPTLNALQSKGILSIARGAAGKYKIYLGSSAGVDTYQRLLSMKVTHVGTTTALFAYVVTDASATAAGPYVEIQFEDAAGANVELGSGEKFLFQFDLSNTSAV